MLQIYDFIFYFHSFSCKKNEEIEKKTKLFAQFEKK